MAANQEQLDSEIAAIQSKDATLQATLQAISVNILGQIANLQQKLTTGQDFTPELGSLTSIANDLGTMDTSAQSLQSQADAAANPVISNPIAGANPPTTPTGNPPATSASQPPGTVPSSTGTDIPPTSATAGAPPISDTSGTPPSPSATATPEPVPATLTPGATPENSAGMPVTPGSPVTLGDGPPNMGTPPSGVVQ